MLLDMNPYSIMAWLHFFCRIWQVHKQAGKGWADHFSPADQSNCWVETKSPGSGLCFYLHQSEMLLLGSASNETFTGKSIQAILSTTIIKMCVFLDEFLSPSAKIFAVRLLFHSQFLFWTFPRKADYVLAVLQTGAAAVRKSGQMGTLVVFFPSSFNYWR